MLDPAANFASVLLFMDLTSEISAKQSAWTLLCESKPDVIFFLGWGFRFRALLRYLFFECFVDPMIEEHDALKPSLGLDVWKQQASSGKSQCIKKHA